MRGYRGLGVSGSSQDWVLFGGTSCKGSAFDKRPTRDPLCRELARGAHSGYKGPGFSGLGPLRLMSLGLGVHTLRLSVGLGRA